MLLKRPSRPKAIRVRQLLCEASPKTDIPASQVEVLGDQLITSCPPVPREVPALLSCLWPVELVEPRFESPTCIRLTSPRSLIQGARVEIIRDLWGHATHTKQYQGVFVSSLAQKNMRALRCMCGWTGPPAPLRCCPPAWAHCLAAPAAPGSLPLPGGGPTPRCLLAR